MGTGLRHIRSKQSDTDDSDPRTRRIENRLGDGAANPYLAATVLLAAGLDGIENQIDPGVQNEDNLYEVPEDELQQRGIGSLPATLATRQMPSKKMK